MNKRLHYYIPLLVSFSMVMGIIIGYRIHSDLPYKRDIFDLKDIEKLEEVGRIIDQYYLEDSVLEQATEKSINALFYELDKYSVYIPREQVADFEEQIHGRYFGIGVEFRMIHDSFTILRAFEGSPSAQVHLQQGDKILKANNVVISGTKKSLDDIFRILKGHKNKKLILQMLRKDSVFEVPISTGPIFQTDISSSYLIDDSVGYIKLDNFNEHSAEEFGKDVLSLKEKKMTSLILDLRNNPGGILSQAVDIADELLSGEKLITYIEGRKSNKREYNARRRGLYEEGRLIVLVNSHSASASEVLAGALQDWDRAIIIGDTTFGKGLVQEQFFLQDGSSVKLTIAKYHTPSGRTLQKDIRNTQKLDTFFSIKGKPLLSNIGIIPDILSKEDIPNNNYLLLKGVLSDSELSTLIDEVFEFVISNKEHILNNYSKKNATFSKSIYQQAYDFVLPKLSLSGKNISQKTKQMLIDEINRHMASFILEPQEYTFYMNRNDKTIKLALQQIQKM